MKDRLCRFYLYLVFLFLYAPIIILMVFSFNESKYRTWSGFSFKWYAQLFSDGKIMDALYNTLFVAVIAALSGNGNRHNCCNRD